jgi:hypothetical protein
VTFSGILTLTYNATSLILPSSAANIATAAGDVAEFIYLGSGNWKALNYAKASGQINGPASNKVLIATYTPASVSNQSDTTSLTATYSEYEIDIENLIPATSSVALYMTIQSGGTFQTTSYIWESLNGSGNSTGSTGSTSDTKGNLTASAYIPNTSGIGITCRIFVSNPAGATSYKVFQNKCDLLSSSTLVTTLGGVQWGGGTGAITGVNFYFSSGNITSGTIKIYGWN